MYRMKSRGRMWAAESRKTEVENSSKSKVWIELQGNFGLKESENSSVLKFNIRKKNPNLDATALTYVGQKFRVLGPLRTF